MFCLNPYLGKFCWWVESPNWHGSWVLRFRKWRRRLDRFGPLSIQPLTILTASFDCTNSQLCFFALSPGWTGPAFHFPVVGSCSTWRGAQVCLGSREHIVLFSSRMKWFLTCFALSASLSTNPWRIYDSSSTLENFPNNTKALFRRCMPSTLGTLEMGK